MTRGVPIDRIDAKNEYCTVRDREKKSDRRRER